MLLGDKLAVIKKQLERYIVDTFNQSGIDSSLGILILDSIKADLCGFQIEHILMELAQLENTSQEEITSVESEIE